MYIYIYNVYTHAYTQLVMYSHSSYCFFLWSFLLLLASFYFCFLHVRIYASITNSTILVSSYLCLDTVNGYVCVCLCFTSFYLRIAAFCILLPLLAKQRESACAQLHSILKGTTLNIEPWNRKIGMFTH